MLAIGPAFMLPTLYTIKNDIYLYCANERVLVVIN